MGYTIKKGDTLSAIARRNGTTVAAIAKANGIADPNKIRAGASLKLPSAPGPIKKADGGLYRERDGIPEPVAPPKITGSKPKGTVPMPKPGPVLPSLSPSTSVGGVAKRAPKISGSAPKGPVRVSGTPTPITKIPGGIALSRLDKKK